MHHFLGDLSCVWQGNIKKFIFLVGLLSTLGVSVAEDPVPSSDLDQKFCNRTQKRIYQSTCQGCENEPCGPEDTFGIVFLTASHNSSVCIFLELYLSDMLFRVVALLLRGKMTSTS